VVTLPNYMKLISNPRPPINLHRPIPLCEPILLFYLSNYFRFTFRYFVFFKAGKDNFILSLIQILRRILLPDKARAGTRQNCQHKQHLSILTCVDSPTSKTKLALITTVNNNYYFPILWLWATSARNDFARSVEVVFRPTPPRRDLAVDFSPAEKQRLLEPITARQYLLT
jgi:hypothetical protein